MSGKTDMPLATRIGSTAFQEGHDAYQRGDSRDACPYGPPDGKYWRRGWDMAEKRDHHNEETTMAEKLNGQTVNDDGGRNVTKLHNAEARAEIIRNGYSRIYQLEQEIAAARQKHIKPLQEEKTKIRRQMKKDLDIAWADLDPGFRSFKRQQRAYDEFEEGEADRVKDNLRESFGALASGEDLNWLQALGVPEQRKDDDPQPAA